MDHGGSVMACVSMGHCAARSRARTPGPVDAGSVVAAKESLAWYYLPGAAMGLDLPN